MMATHAPPSWFRRLVVNVFLSGWTLGAIVGFDLNRPARAEGPGPSPVQRALDYLAREVPRWQAENGCYSCHNNGDGARALYTAAGFSEPVPAESLAETTRWLSQPQQWDKNPGDPAISDKGLARIQFAAALAVAVQVGWIQDRRPLREAAEQLVADQQADGSWKVGAAGSVGSPATYGAVLATYLARRTLERADAESFREAIDRANRWLFGQKARTVLDAAALLLALEGSRQPEAVTRRQLLLGILSRGQSSDGGWGPYENAPPESFDTAVVLLALNTLENEGRVSEMIARGRGYLIAAQLPAGGWLETTRPTGSDSYAQRISTSAWATIALLETALDSPGGKD